MIVQAGRHLVRLQSNLLLKARLTVRSNQVTYGHKCGSSKPQRMRNWMHSAYGQVDPLLHCPLSEGFSIKFGLKLCCFSLCPLCPSLFPCTTAKSLDNLLCTREEDVGLFFVFSLVDVNKQRLSLSCLNTIKYFGAFCMDCSYETQLWS